MASSKASIKVLTRARRVRVLLMDVDGVLTDGQVWLASWPDGAAHEIKGFDAYDGQGLMLLRTMGIRTGIITGRESPAVTRRAKELGLEFAYQAQATKTRAYEEILSKSGAREEEVCYMADDLPDLPVLRRVGFAVAVANAAPEVKKVAHYVTRHSGGAGAVREVAEMILKAQGKWLEAIGKAKA